MLAISLLCKQRYLFILPRQRTETHVQTSTDATLAYTQLASVSIVHCIYKAGLMFDAQGFHRFIIFLIFRIYLGDSGIHGRENVVKSYSRLA